MADVVLDASAILALIFDEPGGDQVARHLPNALVSTVNLAEVVTRLLDYDMPQETIDAVIETLQLGFHSYDHDQAQITAQLRKATRSAGLSLGDRACLALAYSRGIEALTADRAWQDVAGEADVEVTVIR